MRLGLTESFAQNPRVRDGSAVAALLLFHSLNPLWRLPVSISGVQSTERNGEAPTPSKVWLLASYFTSIVLSFPICSLRIVCPMLYGCCKSVVI